MGAEDLFDRGLLYQGHKIVWWWAQGGTALSTGEVGQGYREVADPSVYVRSRWSSPTDGRAGSGQTCSVWTTTPWTLPSNQFAAVKPDLEYSIVAVEREPRKLIMASALVETIAHKVGRSEAHGRSQRCHGGDLIGMRYCRRSTTTHRRLTEATPAGRLKAGGGEQHIAWRVVAADFVTIDTGTGIVHQAPAFGEVDFDVLQAEQARFVEGEGPRLHQRRRPRRHVHQPRRPTTRAAGSRTATATSSAT